MFSASPASPNKLSRPFLKRLIPVVLVILGLTVTAAEAQTEEAMPSSVVLVLKLISATHVEPVTGIVATDDGLVLVPADFVSTGGEIIVLDGGTDIIKHGRPAAIVDRSSPGKMAILSVGGLVRTGITLSDNPLNTQSELHLSAFPPAELMAEGAPPVRVPVELSATDSDAGISVSDSSPLPYVSGPILDACGNLAGVSLTSGPQSLDSEETASVLLGAELRQMIDALQINMPTSSCSYQATQETTVAEAASEGTESQEASPTDQVASDIDEPDLIKPEVYKPFIPQKRLNPFQGAIQPREPVNATRPSLWQLVPTWLLLLGFAMLAVISWKVIMYWRLHRGEFAVPAGADLSSEQVTAPAPDAEPAETTTPGKPRSIPTDGAALPDMNHLPEGCDGLIVVDGLIDTDMRFQRFCAVNTEEISVTVGRSDADININHPFISRSHARFKSHGNLMTLSDLDSGSGTYISGVPCLPGEIMVVEAGDEIFLGDIQIRFSIIHKEAGQS